MKKWFLTVLALLAACTLYAQNEVPEGKTAADKGTAANNTVDSIAPAALVAPDSVPVEEVRHLTRRQQMKYFGHDFSSWFCEVKYLYGRRDVAIGLNISYVPNIMGVYATFMDGVNAYWGSAGVVYRFSHVGSRLDFQAYGGFVAGYGYGAEVGLRLARVNLRHRAFSWLSVSAGAAITNYGSFFTCGLSLPFGVPAAAICLF